ncbi:MAG: Na+-dependent transporter, partial [Pseudolabrys sp.]
MLLSPALLGLLFLAFGFDRQMPGLFFMLVLQMSAPGLMSSPALAALMGLDAALTLASLMVCTAVTPVTASLFSHFFLGSALASPFALGLKLFSIIAGSALAAAMFMFAVAAMDGVSAHFLEKPLLVAELTALAFALALGMIAVTTLIFLRAGRARA